jgi:hypothetical protein
VKFQTLAEVIEAPARIVEPFDDPAMSFAVWAVRKKKGKK